MAACVFLFLKGVGSIGIVGNGKDESGVADHDLVAVLERLFIADLLAVHVDAVSALKIHHYVARVPFSDLEMLSAYLRIEDLDVPRGIAAACEGGGWRGDNTCPLVLLR